MNGIMVQKKGEMEGREKVGEGIMGGSSGNPPHPSDALVT